MELDLGALLSPSISAAEQANASEEETPFLPFEDVIADSNGLNLDNISMSNNAAAVPLDLDVFNNELEKAIAMGKMEIIQEQDEGKDLDTQIPCLNVDPNL